MSIALFNLIKALSKSEKRYFKLSISFHNSVKSHLKLFDAIDKQSRYSSGEYDEAKIKKQFANEAFAKQLAVAKNRLHQQILKSLRLFYANKSGDGKIRELLDFADVLIRKGQREEAVLMLKKAKGLAVIMENYPVVLEINKLLQSLLNPEEVLQLLDEDDSNRETEKRTSEYVRMYMEMGKMLRESTIMRSKSDELKYTAVLQHPLLQNSGNEHAITKQDSYYYFMIHGLIAFVKQDRKTARFFCKKTIELIESNPELLEELQWQQWYASLLGNYIGVCNTPPSPTEAQESINKLFQLSSVSKSVLTLAASNFLYICLEALNLDAAFLFLKKNEKMLPLVEGGISNIHLCWYYLNLTSLYFLSGDFKKAHQCLCKIIYEMPLQEREDTHCMARIINLIVLYELGEPELLENNIRSTYRFLHQRNRMYQFEDAILLFIRQELTNAKGKKKVKELFGRMAEKLKKLFKDPYEKKVLEYFDFISWLESKIQNRPMIEIMKEKSLKVGKV